MLSTSFSRCRSPMGVGWRVSCGIPNTWTTLRNQKEKDTYSHRKMGKDDKQGSSQKKLYTRPVTIWKCAPSTSTQTKACENYEIPFLAYVTGKSLKFGIRGRWDHGETGILLYGWWECEKDSPFQGWFDSIYNNVRCAYLGPRSFTIQGLPQGNTHNPPQTNKHVQDAPWSIAYYQ